MLEEKSWYASKGVWGGLVAAGAGILSLFGIHVPEGEIQTLADSVMSIATAAGGLFAVYGRIVANSKIG